MKCQHALFVILTLAVVAWGKVDLATLPARDTVQLTIYNSADLTLARESRALTLKEGANALQFSWANTLIDPTSLEMLPKANAGQIDIVDLVYPPGPEDPSLSRSDAGIGSGLPIMSQLFKKKADREGEGQGRLIGRSSPSCLGLWHITSQISGQVPVEISYFTSGLSWRAFYMGTLSPDEKTMRLQAYVRVTNNSGEDYANAQVRLVVGQVHLLDEIARLARRPYPYGTPIDMVNRDMVSYALPPADERRVDTGQVYYMLAPEKPKQIVKEGLSEYFLYTIEGTETIPNGWSKKLTSFEVDAVPVVNLYKFEEERYGSNVVRFLSFPNDTEHELGATPIPGGVLKVYRDLGSERHLSYVGQSEFKYIPVGEEVELNLGPVADVVVEPTLMEHRTDNYRFNRRGDISGSDEIDTYRVQVRNTRDVPVKLQFTRIINGAPWDLTYDNPVDEYENVDAQTIRFTMELAPRSTKTFHYTLTRYLGVRVQERLRESR